MEPDQGLAAASSRSGEAARISPPVATIQHLSCASTSTFYFVPSPGFASSSPAAAVTPPVSCVRHAAQSHDPFTFPLPTREAVDRPTNVHSVKVPPPSHGSFLPQLKCFFLVPFFAPTNSVNSQRGHQSVTSKPIPSPASLVSSPSESHPAMSRAPSVRESLLPHRT
jgi:hypothetical protein